MSNPWYRVNKRFNLTDVTRIDEVEVIKDTHHFVTLVGGRRDAKDSQYYTYVQTKGEAKQCVIKNLESTIEKHESKIKRETKRLNETIDKLEQFKNE